jgi:hypothetical protein
VLLGDDSRRAARASLIGVLKADFAARREQSASARISDLASALRARFDECHAFSSQ